MNKQEEIERKIAAIQALAINFNADVPHPLLKMWLKLLSRYSPEQVEAGVEFLIENYPYKTLPPFAELKKAIEQCSPGYIDEDTLKIAAEAEWAKLREMVPRIGIYRTPTFDNKTTECVVRMMGGWSAQCNMRQDEKPYRRKEFIELFVSSFGKEETMLSGGNAVLELSEGQKRLQKLKKSIGVTPKEGSDQCKKVSQIKLPALGTSRHNS